MSSKISLKMKKIGKIIFLFSLMIIIYSCNENEIDYKYANKEDLFECNNKDYRLVKEATYAFEDFITKNYVFLGVTVPEGYHNYLKVLFNNRPPAVEYLSDHIKNLTTVFEKHNDLWTVYNNKVRLNYKHPVAKCIVDNIKDEELKKILDALISSNTVTPQVLAPILFEKKHLMAEEDRALAAYVTMDMFFSKLLEMRLPGYVEESQNFDKKEFNIDNAQKLGKPNQAQN